MHSVSSICGSSLGVWTLLPSTTRTGARARYYHEGMSESERGMLARLFEAGAIQVLGEKSL